MNERVRSTKLHIHVKHVFGFGVLARAQCFLKHVRKAMVHLDHAIFGLYQTASNRCSNVARELFMPREQLDFFVGEITVIKAIA
jgi:hypothetical protein